MNGCRQSFVSLDVACGFVRYLIGRFSGNEHELVELYQSRREIVRTIQNRERRVVLESSPADANWISNITMEEHDAQHVQKFLQQFSDTES